MRMATKLPIKNVLKKCYPTRTWEALVAPSSGRQHGSEQLGRGPVTNDKAPLQDDKYPVIAFSKPPLPPFLGPLLVLSLLNTNSSKED
ncbi:hypothetical protein AMTRI_Chr09g16010 [Amborella trichopoda]